MLRNYLLKFFLLFVLFGASHRSFAQYADLGSGALKDKIWWIDWSGFSMVNGAAKTFTTTNGLTVTVTFSNVSGPLLAPSVMNTWYGAVLHLLYDFSNTAVKPALYHTQQETAVTKFTLTVSATRYGLAVPMQLIAADAEGSAPTEITTLQTNGSNWNTVDFFRNSSQTSNPLNGCNTPTVKISDTYDGAQIGQNPVVSTQTPATGPLVMDITLDHSGFQGRMGLAFGVLEAVDRGDLPAGYGHAQHRLQYTYSNVCNYLPPFPTSTQDAGLKLGALPGDADGIQSLNDNASGADEDAVASFPFYAGNGSYTVSLPVTNTTGSTAYLAGWFDANGNGAFDAGESQTAVIPVNSTFATLTWTGVPLLLSKTANYGFRFRLSSDITAVQSATGYARDGEVEDYLTSIPQNVSAGFTAPDTVCVNTPVTIANTSTSASSYYWNFCVANSLTLPSGTNIGGSNLSLPVFCDYAKDGNNYYAFVTNNAPGKLVRLSFGNSLLNTPVYTDFGDLGGAIPAQCEGIQVVYNEGKWYAIVVGGQPVGRIVKVEFGASLGNNSPAAINWGNVGNLAYPTDLHVFQSGTTWYGLTVNSQTNSITRFNFTNSFTNAPTGVNLGAFGGMNYPTGIYAVSKGGLWYAFVSNAGTGLSNSTDASLTRLDFGTSLLNTPAGVNLGNPGNALSSPRDLTIYQSCNEIFGYVAGNATGKELVRLNFNNSLTAVPTATVIGNTGSLSFPHSVSKLFRVNSDLYAFVTNVNNNTLTRLQFSGCTAASLPNSTAQNPPPVAYYAPGTYNISLTVDDGLPTQAAFCKQVVVVSSTHTALQTKRLCNGDSVLLTSGAATGNQWNTGSTAQSIYVKTAGTYWVQSSNGGCVNIDSFVVNVNPKPVVNLGKDTALCTADSLVLDAGNAGASFLWQNGQSSQTTVVKQSGLYYVTVTKDGCSAGDSLTVSPLDSPVVTLTPNTSVCKGSSVTLNAGGGAAYYWSPSAGLTSANTATTVAKPDTTTKYYVTVTGANSCKARDSVTVTVLPQPVVNLGKDTSLCTADSLLLDAGNGGAAYAWQNGQTTQTFLVKTAGTYYVAVSKSICVARDTIVIDPLPSPVVDLTDGASICRTASITLMASGANTYKWWPVKGLSDSTGPTITARPDTTTTYHLLATGSNGCTVKDSVTITVTPMPVFSVQSSKPILCVGDTATLSAHGGDAYTWLPSLWVSNPYSNSTAAFPPTTTLFSVVVEDSTCNIVDTLSLTLPVADKPTVALTKSNDINCFQAQATLTAGGGTRYLWHPSTGLSDSTGRTPVVSIGQSITYRVTMLTAEGCQVEDSITVYVNKSGDGSGFPVPGAFTPNGDGRNDCFGVPHWGAVTAFSLNLYNRWGERVFHADAPSQCWDGVYKGVPQPGDVYVYWIKAETLCGEVFRKGTFALIR